MSAKFINPFDLIPELSDADYQPLETDNLRRIRKRYLSEFDLDDTGLLQLQGTELSKNDILSIFDRLNDARELYFYQLLHKDILFSKFLTEAKLPPTSSFLPEETYNNEDFIEWVSPYYLHSFKIIAFQNHKDSNPWKLVKLITLDYYCTGEQDEEYTRILESIIRQTVESARLLVADQENGDTPGSMDIHRVFSSEWTELFNRLSDDYSLLREEYAVLGINLSSHLFNHKNKKLAIQVCEAINNLECNPENLKIKEDNYSVIVNGEHPSSKKYWWIGFVLYMLIRMAACNN